tara:strand:- start:609 stop:728 length:120 start_codon:yes stop_codon:yes gene_type:complete
MTVWNTIMTIGAIGALIGLALTIRNWFKELGEDSDEHGC